MNRSFLSILSFFLLTQPSLVLGGLYSVDLQGEAHDFPGHILHVMGTIEVNTVTNEVIDSHLTFERYILEGPDDFSAIYLPRLPKVGGMASTSPNGTGCYSSIPNPQTAAYLGLHVAHYFYGSTRCWHSSETTRNRRQPWRSSDRPNPHRSHNEKQVAMAPLRSDAVSSVIWYTPWSPSDET